MSKCIIATIVLAYELVCTPLPATIHAHSTSAVAASTAFLTGVGVPDICKAATWNTPSTIHTACPSFPAHHHIVTVSYFTVGDVGKLKRYRAEHAQEEEEEEVEVLL